LGADALEEELKTNQNVVIAAGVEGGEALNAGPRKEKANDERAAHRPKTVTMPLPASYDEAWRIVHQFERADEIKEQISDSVAHCCLKGTGSLMDEQWSGTEESEREAFVTEELYIHAKVSLVVLSLESGH
jgi:phospholipase D1/2